MHAVDWICLGVLVASLLLGAWRGLLYEAFSLGGWLVAYLVARVGAATVGQLLPMGASPEQLRYVAGFVLLFIAVAFLGGMVAWAARGTARALGMRAVDRVFGALFGVGRGALVLLVGAFAIRVLGMDEAPWWSESVSSGWLEIGLSYFQPLIPEALLQYLEPVDPMLPRS